MSGHSSRWSYQMGSLSEPHLQQQPLTLATASTPQQREVCSLCGCERGIKGSTSLWGANKKGIEDERDPLGMSDHYGMAAFKSSMNTRLPAGTLISTVMILLLHGMFPATGRWLTEPVHTFTHIQHTPGLPHQWTQPDTPLSCLIRRLQKHRNIIGGIQEAVWWSKGMRWKIGTRANKCMVSSLGALSDDQCFGQG